LVTAGPEIVEALAFFVALPVATRSSNPIDELARRFSIAYKGSLLETLEEWLPDNGVVRSSALATLAKFGGPSDRPLIVSYDWLRWRSLDGSPFCELARYFYACLLEEIFAQEIGNVCESAASSHRLFARHAWDLTRITQAFSARWYNACVSNQIPSQNCIRWYNGHCAGKLDMELERELSTHVEPPPRPSSRRKKEPAIVALPFEELSDYVFWN